MNKQTFNLNLSDLRDVYLDKILFLRKTRNGKTISKKERVIVFPLRDSCVKLSDALKVINFVKKGGGLIKQMFEYDFSYNNDKKFIEEVEQSSIPWSVTNIQRDNEIKIGCQYIHKNTLKALKIK